MTKKALEVTTIDRLVADPHNARRHTPANIRAIRASIEDVGLARSIVIDEDNRVLAGNGVLEAAALEGVERVVVVEADGETVVAVARAGLSEADKRRLAIADNRTNELSQWDANTLHALLDGVPIQAAGFSEDEVARLRRDPAAPAEFAAVGDLPVDKRCRRCGYEWT